jgi:hypothetical protein
VLWWGSAYVRRSGVFWQQQRATTAALKEQTFWLNNRTKIDEAAQKAASRLVPEQTLDATRLAAAVNQAAREAGLKNYGTTPAPDQTNGQFTIHSVNAQATQADYEALQKFYLNLQQRAPYIAIESFTLSSVRNNASLLNLVLRVSSVEVAR